MPTYDTPKPISATIDLGVGDVRLTAGDRATTVVDVRPSDPSNDDDTRAANATRIDFANGQLLIKAPKLRQWLPRSDGGSIDVTVELPAGSNLSGSAGYVDFRCDGRLGTCRIKVGLGDIEVEQADAPHLESGAGDITVGHATGAAELTARRPPTATSGCARSSGARSPSRRRSARSRSASVRAPPPGST